MVQVLETAVHGSCSDAAICQFGGEEFVAFQSGLFEIW